MCRNCNHYDFHLDRLVYSHAWCRHKFEKALVEGVNAVVVDNTNVSATECRPYVEMALKYGYAVEFLEPTTPWAFDIDQLFVKNTHNVPREALERMLGRWVPDMTIEKALGKPQPGLMHEDEKAAFVPKG
jgi:predicted kinase